MVEDFFTSTRKCTWAGCEVYTDSYSRLCLKHEAAMRESEARSDEDSRRSNALFNDKYREGDE